MCWAAFPSASFSVETGAAREWVGDGGARRFFCGECGTGLYYLNDLILPGIVDIPVGVLEDAGRYAPQAQVQAAERLQWTPNLDPFHAFERYPGQ